MWCGSSSGAGVWCGAWGVQCVVMVSNAELCKEMRSARNHRRARKLPPCTRTCPLVCMWRRDGYSMAHASAASHVCNSWDPWSCAPPYPYTLSTSSSTAALVPQGTSLCCSCSTSTQVSQAKSIKKSKHSGQDQNHAFCVPRAHGMLSSLRAHAVLSACARWPLCVRTLSSLRAWQGTAQPYGPRDQKPSTVKPHALPFV